MIPERYLRKFCVKPGSRVRLKNHETGWAQSKDLKRLGKDATKARVTEAHQENLAELAEAQELLWASDTHSILVVLQAMDAAGKDGTIKHVMTGVNPQGCNVTGFKRPSDIALDHNFLWRYAKAVPQRGTIGIFNRSYYEEVLVVRVHPHILESQKLPPGKRGKAFWNDRFDDINAFERHLTRNGTTILKFFLHISKEEQKRRFLDRLNDPEKHWKFSAADLAERGHWDTYAEAFEDAMSATSTEWAPWHIVPADSKWLARAIVADVLTSSIKALNLRYPKVTDEDRKRIAAARRQLEAE